ncbi:helix-turn-helix domain-containing protein [Streptomyces sp. NPDC060311]|uniref:helix-turn-helix domain-containing protein n=1 Tax=Streptomyces sp. NPDC060311 TaxID=3347096 RepID=UPI00366333D7
MTTPTLLTGALAAVEAGVSPATIRKWVQRGHLSPAGRQGRAQLFRLEDVFAAERDARGGRGGRGGRPGASGRDAQGVRA